MRQKNELVRPLGGLAIAQCLMSHDIEHTIWVQRIALSDVYLSSLTIGISFTSESYTRV